MTILPRIIGIAGASQVGKDELARHITTHRRLAFADELKRRVAYALQITAEELERNKTRLRDVLVAVGAGARSFNPDVWIAHVEQWFSTVGNYVIPDVRYLNEANMIHRHGGIVVYLKREGYTYANSEEAASLPLVEAKADVVLTTIEGDRAATFRRLCDWWGQEDVA